MQVSFLIIKYQSLTRNPARQQEICVVQMDGIKVEIAGECDSLTDVSGLSVNKDDLSMVCS